jgi:hypothetical protein
VGFFRVGTGLYKRREGALDKAIAAFTKVAKKYDILGKTKDEIIAVYRL